MGHEFCGVVTNPGDSDFKIGNPILNDMVYRNQHGMRNSNIGTLLSAVRTDPGELGRKIRVLVFHSRMRAYNQCPTEQGIPFPRLSRLSFVCAFIISRTKSWP